MTGALPEPGRRWRNVGVVREHDLRRGRWLWRLLLGLLTAAVPVAFYVLQQVNYVQVRYKIEELRGQQERLLEAERRLRIERAALEALPVVEERAARELDLARPAPERVVVVPATSPGHGDRSARAPGVTMTVR
jgi:cell division protein FtsL